MPPGVTDLYKKTLYFLAFVGLFLLVCYLLSGKFLARFIYPLHYREYIFQSADKYNVDPFLVAAVIYTESGFRSEAVSNRGACGLMQIMPSTAEWAAEMMQLEEYSAEALFDPRQNIEIGTWYLSSLFQEFQDNRVVVLAAYNGGRGRVAGWLKTGVWDGNLKTLDHIPLEETRNFVRRVLKAYTRYQQVYG